MHYRILTGLRFLLFIELCLFGHTYLFGMYGLRKLSWAKKEFSVIDDEIENLQKEIEKLKQEMALWQQCHFVKEKIAREQLNMARDHDEIYYLT